MAHPPWTSEQIMLLIDAYRSHECLWKMQSEDYGDQSKRTMAWQAIALVVGCDFRTAEKKIKTLRTQFMNYHKTALKKTTLRGGAEEFKRPKWFAYTALEFLLEARPLRSCLETRSDDYKIRLERDALGDGGSARDHHEDITVKWESLEPHDMDYMDQNLSQDHPHPPDTFKSHQNPHLNKQLAGFSSLQGRDSSSTFVKMKSPNSSCSSSVAEQRDEFTIFGEHVACRLRNIPDPHTRLLVQHRIHTVLFEAEMGKVDHLSSGGGSSGTRGVGGC